MSEKLGGDAGSQVQQGRSEDIGDGTTAQGAQQPEHFAFDEQSEAEIAKILTRYPPSRKTSGVIPLLYIVQNQMARQTGRSARPRRAGCAGRTRW